MYPIKINLKFGLSLPHQVDCQKDVSQIIHHLKLVVKDIMEDCCICSSRGIKKKETTYSICLSNGVTKEKYIYVYISITANVK